jgi:hypothetical protein
MENWTECQTISPGVIKIHDSHEVVSQFDVEAASYVKMAKARLEKELSTLFDQGRPSIIVR